MPCLLQISSHSHVLKKQSSRLSDHNNVSSITSEADLRYGEDLCRRAKIALSLVLLRK